MRDEAEVPDLYRLAFIPGCFRCPKCEFALCKQTLSVATGNIGTTEENRLSEPCPNDGTMMVHVTYRERLQDYADRLDEEIPLRIEAERKFKEHTEHVGKFLTELYAIMVDPLEDGVIPVAEMCERLKAAAIAQREREHDKA